MKKVVTMIAAVLILAACSKENVSLGKYSAITNDGTLCIELLSGGDCVLYFDGGTERQGDYKLSGDEIVIHGHADIKTSTKWRWYYFTVDNPGRIESSTKFTVPVEISSGDKTTTKTLTFLKR